MFYFLKSEGVNLWDVVENGPFTPTKIIDGVHVAKPKVNGVSKRKEE